MKIGTTSYIYPDNIIPNVRKLSDLVDDIELVLFEGKEYSNLPSKEDIDILKTISDETELSYTVHLPIDLDICSGEKAFREFSLRRVLGIMDLTSPLNPSGYVLHLPRKNIESEESWTSRTIESLSNIYAHYSKESVLVENLSYPIKHILPIIEQLNSNLCLDISHALRCSDNWEEIFNNYFNRIKEIHFYGPETESEGHLGLQKASREFVRDVVGKIMSSKFSGILTLEVFGVEDFFESKKIVEEEILSWGKRYLSQAE